MKKNAIIFGTGLIYSIIKQVLFDQFNIVAIFDNNHAKWNTAIDGVTICNPKFVGELQYDAIIIAASHSIEIAKQLRSLGVPVSKIEIGANYVFRRIFSADDISIRLSLKQDCSLACKVIRNRANLIDVNVFQDKTVLLDPLGIPALIALFENKNHLPAFFRLSETHHGPQKGTFLDIGANIGTTSIQATEFPNVDAVISFEPSRDVYALLMANVYLNKLENKIAAFRYAVGDTQSTTKLMLSPLSSGDNRIRREDHLTDFQRSESGRESILSEDVSTIVIDDFLRKELASIKYVWIDVQGYEYFVLKGCEALLAKDNVSVQIEYWPHGLIETNSLDLLNQYLIANFRAYIDMNEYADSKPIVHDIRDVSFLSDELLQINSNFHTDLFLLK
jgi:FkbM family methyltransferase